MLTTELRLHCSELLFVKDFFSSSRKSTTYWLCDLDKRKIVRKIWIEKQGPTLKMFASNDSVKVWN